MGRLKTLTIVLTLGAWGAATEGAPPDDAATTAASASRPAPPCHPSVYVKAAQKLAQKNDPRAADYLKAASDYRDMLSADDAASLDQMLAKTAPQADSSVSRTSATAASVPPGRPSFPPAQPSGMSTRGSAPTDAKQKARWLLSNAREQMAQGHFAEAQQMLDQAKTLDVRWTLFDDTPAKVSADIEKNRPKTTVAPTATKGDRRQAREQLKQARQMISDGNYDGAESSATEVASWNLRFNMLEDSPQKVVDAARALKRRDVARNTPARKQPSEALYTAAVAQARGALAAGKLDIAEQKARQAMNMNVAVGVDSDRAETVLNDVATARAGIQTGSPTAVAANNAPMSDPSISRVSAEAPSTVADRDGDALLAKGDTAAAKAKYAEAAALADREAGNAPLALEPAPMEPAPLGNDPMPAPAALDNAPSMTPAAAGDGSLAQARDLMVNGNFAAARQAAQAAKQKGAGLEADEMLAQIGQTEQGAALRMYESVLDSVRKGAEADMSHAREMLDQLSTMELDEATAQKVQDLQMRLPREGAGRAQVGGAIDDKDAVLAQKLNAEVGTKVAEARRLMETDPEKAINLLRATTEQVKTSGCKEAVVKNMTRRLEVAIELAKKDKVVFDQKMQEKSFKAEIERKKLRILEADKAKNERMTELMKKAEQASADGKYEEAEKFYGMAAEIDPNEIAAIAGRTLAKTKRYMKRENALRAGLQETFVTSQMAVSETGIVSDKVQRDGIELGEGFAALTASRRDLAQRLAPKKDAQVLEIEKALNKPVTIHMDKTSLGEAVKYLNELTGLNIVPDNKALAEVGMSQNSPVEFHSDRLKLKQALKLFLRDHDLTYVIEEGAVVITTQQANRQKTEVRVYNVADLVMKVGNRRPDGTSAAAPQPAMTDPNLLQAQANAMNGAPGQFVPPSSPDSNAEATRNNREIDMKPLIDLIKASIAPGTWAEDHSDPMAASYGQGAGDADNAIGSITPFFLNISLIIRHTAEVHDDIVDLLRQLRRLQDLQVSIEVRFITVSDSFFEQIGVDFDFSIQSDAIGRKSSLATATGNFVNTGTTGTTGTTAGTTGGTTATTATTAGNNAYTVNTNRDHALGSGVTTVGHTGANPQGNGNPGEFTNDLQIPFTQGGAGAITPFNALTGSTAATFGIAFLSDLEVYLFLTAVQGDTRANLVQAPKVTTFNGAFASVSNFTARYYVQSLTPVVGAGAVAFSPSIGSIPDGVVLGVTPVVSADRRYVRMTLSPQFITFIQFDVFNVPAGVGGGGIGGQSINISSQVQLPQFSITNVSTTVTVPDGGTVLLGGVKRLQEQRTEIGVPILAKTPLINRLFRNIGIGRQTTSLMLMVTPRIVILEEEEEKLGIPAVNVTF